MNASNNLKECNMGKIISIGVVAYNEEKYLPNLLGDICSQDYPHNLIEVILIDGGSNDSTRRIMDEFKNNNTDFYSIQVFSNPKRTQASGWNIAIDNFTGDVLSRIDAHSKLTFDFISNVMLNIEQGESVVGGIRPAIIENETNWSNVLLQVENSLFGSNVNKSRRSNEKTYVKTMFHASYTREVLEKVGHFNEQLLRTEDNEFHYRIRSCGYKLCYDPRIISYQYARNGLKKMIKQKFANGFWVGKTVKYCPGCISVYHLVPFAFFWAIIITTIIALLGFWPLSALMWCLYALFAVFNTIVSIINNGFRWQNLIMPGMFLLLHISYGVGTTLGLISKKIKKGDK